MARTGQFGQRPRAMPNLSSTILAIAREQEARRAQNIMDAWAKGGLFEGKKATDEMVLAFWNKKLKDLSHDDPLYDAYHNNVLQLQYGIEQSKMDLLHVQGKISDAQFAQFYLNWSKKVPRNSEFYRALQKDAAQLKQQSAASGRAAAARARADAFSQYSDGITKSHIALGDTMTGVMTQIARDNNLIGQDEGLDKFMLKGQDDPAIMEHLLDIINTDMKANPAKYKGLTDTIRKLDPSWNGKLTSGYYAKTLKRQGEGYDLIGKRASKDGYTSWVQWASKGKADTHELGIQSRAWPTGAAYSEARKAFDTVMNNPNSTAADKIAASDQFANALDKMALNKDLDASFINRLKNDALALRGSPDAKPQSSFSENFLGLTPGTAGQDGADGAAKGEVGTWQKEQGEARYWAAQMQANPAGLVYGSQKPGTNPPEFDPTGKGPIGVVTTASVAHSPQETQTVPTTSVTGQPIMVASAVRSIYAIDPLTGKKGADPIGKAIVYQQGNKQTTLYGITLPDGSSNWTPVAPWADNVSETRETGGDITLSLRGFALNHAAIAAKVDADLKAKGITGSVGLAFADGKVPSDGTEWEFKTLRTSTEQTTVKVVFKNGTLQTSDSTTFYANGAVAGQSSTPMTPAVAIDLKTAVTDETRWKNGRNPAIDFQTATMAALSTNQMNRDQVEQIWSNPQFQSVLQGQERQASRGDTGKYMQLALEDAQTATDITKVGPDVVRRPNGRETPNHASTRSDLIYPTFGKDSNYPDESRKVGIQFGTDIKLPTLPTGLIGAGLGAAQPGALPFNLTTPGVTPPGAINPNAPGPSPTPKPPTSIPTTEYTPPPPPGGPTAPYVPPTPGGTGGGQGGYVPKPGL